jgi:hypothetical protein
VAFKQKDVHIERLVRFVGGFSSLREEDRLEEQNEVIELLISFLMTYLAANDKAVRFRACQLLHLIMNQQPEDFVIDEVVPKTCYGMALRVLVPGEPSITAAVTERNYSCLCCSPLCRTALLFFVHRSSVCSSLHSCHRQTDRQADAPSGHGAEPTCSCSLRACVSLFVPPPGNSKQAWDSRHPNLTGAVGHRAHEDPMYGCQIGTTYPFTHVK